MADYTAIDPVIKQWVRKHRLFLHAMSGETQVRNAYVSSRTGTCFQIWIDPPVDEVVELHAAYVTGPIDAEIAQDWRVPLSELEVALEVVFDTVLDWMKPSTRYFPKNTIGWRWQLAKLLGHRATR